MKKVIARTAALGLTLVPTLALGATVGAPSDFKGLVDILLGIMQTLVLLVFGLTFLTIIWSVVKGWIIHGGDAEGVESGKNVVLVGIIALVVMTSIWGILYLLKSSIFG
jgi:hypothetical protein